ncbi:MAG: DUF3179 domain-containing protein [Salinibacter sp.]|uniref:DUF3179 domain-containing protein n=1 Tax=Salinibacter sp. TaxID=2065818 RepID=UPI0035D44BA8
MKASAVNSRLLVCLLILGSLVLGGCDSGPSGPQEQDSDSGFNLENCTIPADRLVDGGVGKDGIPALTNPPLVDPSAGTAQYLADTSRVIGLLVGDTSLAVPHNILWHHEIINFNDRLGRTFAVTYCPLTGSSLAFDREGVDGAEFGVSGLLFNNNLVMYDRRNKESLWPQMNRQANCGVATGTTLETIPVVEMRWSRWRSLHPDTKVVSSQTGYARDYRPSAYPYGGYERLNSDPLFQMPVDDRRPPKERVLGIPVGDDGGVALPFGALDDGSAVRVVPVTAGGTQMTVFWSRKARGAMAFETSSTFSVEDGRIVDDATGSVWTVDGRAIEGPRAGDQLDPVDRAYVAFWFAWAGFQPETRLWTNSSG